MRLAATRSSISFGSAGPADAGAAWAAARAGPPNATAAARAAPPVSRSRLAIADMSIPLTSAPLRQPVPRQVDGLGEPDVLPAEHVLDEAVEHAHPRRAAHHLR